MRSVGPGEDATFAQQVNDVTSLPRCRSASFTLNNKINAKKQPRPTHITNERVYLLKRLQRGFQISANPHCILLQFFVSEDIEHRKPGSASHRIAAECAEKFHAIG